MAVTRNQSFVEYQQRDGGMRLGILMVREGSPQAIAIEGFWRSLNGLRREPVGRLSKMLAHRVFVEVLAAQLIKVHRVFV
jgi:hypothetical protein